jgi:hypothetical protein
LTWYFIVYQHEYVSKTSHHTQEWSNNETITNIHPVEFLVDLRNKHGESEQAIYHYLLKFWAEIPEEIALKFKERLE